MSSPPVTTEHSDADIARTSLASAAEHRAQHVAEEGSHTKSRRERELRIHFWRLISPGILRPNAIDTAIASMKVLATLSGNILKDPENPKYHHFKSTNNAIRRNLVEVRGALEYAVEMGFHQRIEDMQPVYYFNPRQLEDLRVGNAVLNEAIEQETAKQKRGKFDPKADKEAKALAAKNALLAFEDDRRAKALRDEREAIARRTADSATTHHPMNEDQEISGSLMELSEAGGHTLGERPHERDENVALDQQSLTDEKGDQPSAS